jgi:hypothetical protein
MSVVSGTFREGGKCYEIASEAEFLHGDEDYYIDEEASHKPSKGGQATSTLLFANSFCLEDIVHVLDRVHFRLVTFHSKTLIFFVCFIYVGNDNAKIFKLMRCQYKNISKTSL